ncbi:transcription factor TFIIIC subunit [Maudiozyma humilis]|uniref:Transcription factor TFIIIC subunit n=1 Tax=Maudiozyma humilis TaxID=51915 RepID=A0AAV5RU95_MAUHU|nr:transcription factor TFIIIC subunit [Kazachstania humilis]
MTSSPQSAMEAPNEPAIAANLDFLTQPSYERVTAESGALAKEYTLDIPRIPSVELPLHVSARPESINKAVHMCGGLQKVKDMLKEANTKDSDSHLELYLNKTEQSHYAEGSFFNEHPIIGKPVPHRDHSVMLKVVMPKGTMKKHGNDVQKAMASLRQQELKVTPVAVVDSTIKFREMSDFQYRLDNAPAAAEFSASFGSMDWPKFKQFVDSVPDNDSMPQENINRLVLDRSLKTPDTDYQLPPPPRLSMIGFPHIYKYKKNPLATKKSDGATEVKGSYIKNYQLFVHELGKRTKIPTEPHKKLQHDYDVAREKKVYPGTKETSKFYELLEECLELLHGLFARRPIWIKRHLDGIVPKRLHHTLKIALALVTYRFTMGPWRNTYIKFGCDPRSSSEYAKYQTEYFKIERKLLASANVQKNIPKLKETVFESNVPGDIDTRFRFDGKQIPWYLMLQIDLLVYEPNVAEVYAAAEYLPEPNEVTGWFSELDLVKMRRIVKYELGCLAQGNSEFNKYKLKYFKSMQFVKESLMTEGEAGETAAGAANAVDADGDVDMDKTAEGSKNIGDDDDDDDNGIITGEADDDALEEDESDTNDNVRVDDGEDEEKDEQGPIGVADDFDVSNADFKDIIDRIAQTDPATAAQLQAEMAGFVNISKI